MVLSAVFSLFAAVDLLAWMDAAEAAWDSLMAWSFYRLIQYDLKFAVHSRGGVLVTGAGSGIGAHAAVTLAERGFTVFAGVRSLPDGHRLKQHLSPEAEGNLIPIVLDITNPAHIDQATDDIRFRLAQHTTGPADARQLVGIINCAGVPFVAPMEVVNPKDYLQVLNVNTVGPMALIQAVLPLLRESKGRVINVSSVTGFTASPMHGVYASSKMALEAATDSLRVELYRWGISVSLIEPGSVDTRLWSNMPTTLNKTPDTHLIQDASASAYPSASASASGSGSGSMSQRTSASNRKSMHRPSSHIAPGGPPHIAAPMTDAQSQLYSPLIQSVDTILRETRGHLLSPEYTTRAIVHALTSSYPRTRYFVGFDAKMTSWMRAVFSDRVLDWGYQVLIHQLDGSNKSAAASRSPSSN
ncbi:hypothetical protein BC831DRAFT_486019 [Entophlyctis helioformis]|nr:hypothetical protein BC831DRAFT_486019 [Entophlyctis helioformis]